MATFGYTQADVTDTNGFTLWADYVTLIKHTLSEDGAVSKLTVKLDSIAESGSQVIKGVIYDDDGGSGNPGTLLGTSNELSVAYNAATAEYDLTFASAVNLTAGDYWIGTIAGATTKVRRIRIASSGATLVEAADAYSNGPDASFGGIDDSYSYKPVLYATYTASGISIPLLNHLLLRD